MSGYIGALGLTQIGFRTFLIGPNYPDKTKTKTKNKQTNKICAAPLRKLVPFSSTKGSNIDCTQYTLVAAGGGGGLDIEAMF